MKQLVAIPSNEFRARLERGEKPELPMMNESCALGTALVIETAENGDFVARVAHAATDRNISGVSLEAITQPPMPVVAAARAVGEQPMVWVVESES